MITFTKQAALDKGGSRLSEMRNHSCYEWSRARVCVCACLNKCVCVYVCVRAADNEEIISTLFLFLFSPLSPAPLPPLPDILHCFSYYFAFVSEHLFLAPLPPACFAREGEKEGNKKKAKWESVCARERKQKLPLDVGIACGLLLLSDS